MSLPIYVLPSTHYDDKLKKSFIDQLSLHVELDKELSPTLSPLHIVIFRPQGRPNDEFNAVVLRFLDKCNLSCRNIILFTAFAMSQRYGCGFTPDCASRFKYIDKLLITSGHLDTQVNKCRFKRLGDVLGTEYGFKQKSDDQPQLRRYVGSVHLCGGQELETTTYRFQGNHANSKEDISTFTASHTNSQEDTSTGNHVKSIEDKGISTGSKAISKEDKGISTGSKAISKEDNGISTGSKAISKEDNGISTGSKAISKEDNGISTGSKAISKEDNGTSTGSKAYSQEDSGTSTASHTISQEDNGTSTGNHANSQKDNGTSTASHTNSQEDNGTSTGNHANSQEDNGTSTARHVNSQEDNGTSTASHTNSQEDNGTPTASHTNSQEDNGTPTASHANSQEDNGSSTASHANSHKDNSTFRHSVVSDILRNIQEGTYKGTTELQMSVETKFKLPPGILFRILDEVLQYLNQEQESAVEIQGKSPTLLGDDMARKIEDELEMDKGSLNKIIQALLKESGSNSCCPPHSGPGCDQNLDKLRTILEEMKTKTTDLQKAVEKKCKLPPGILPDILDEVLKCQQNQAPKAAGMSETRGRSPPLLGDDMASGIENQLVLKAGSLHEIIDAVLKFSPKKKKGWRWQFWKSDDAST